VKRLRWELPESERRVPRHPYRDSALVYGALAIIVVVVAAATGGDIGRAIFFALAAFVVATAWSWRKFRNRLREDRARSDRVEENEPPG
jgi:membrane protein implicated in regulation of membrane protease activity